MDIVALGAKIRDLRKAAKLTQGELAEKADYSERALQRLEGGDGNPTIETLNKLAIALKASLILTFGGEKDLELFTLFSLANDRNQGLIIGYAEGLLKDHQPDPGAGRTKGPNKIL